MRPLFLILVVGALSHAEGLASKRLLSSSTPTAKLKNLPKLFELKRGEAVLSKGPILPRRVYLVYEKDAKKWLYTLTDSSGKFPQPPEYLTPDSVLPGPYLGGLYPKERYRVDSKGKWVRTEEEERYNLIVLSTPPKIKWVMFNEPLRPWNQK